MKKIIIKIIAKLILFYQYSKALRGTVLYHVIKDEVLNKERLRQIEINGYKVFVRTNTPDIKVAISSLYEKEYEGIKVDNPKVIIDAGANIGTSTLYFSKKYPEAIIYMIEPEEGNYELLLKNTSGLKNVVSIKAALWGKSEQRTIQNRHTGHWGYTVSETTNEITSTGQQIDCITIPMIMETYQIEKIDLLKIDIEGGEKDVLEHSNTWISNVEIIAIELHDRITMGCDRAFYLATKAFRTFERNGEKVTAYRT